MTNRRAIPFALAALLCSCSPRGEADVMAGGNVTTKEKTTQCTVPNADGVRCDRKTCKKDQKSDCRDFADRCAKFGNSYEGDNDSGECIRPAGTDNIG